jgi:DNA-directed RNA polymerase subunit RPC12/RpoP
MITFRCPTCKAFLNQHDDQAGKKMPCPSCGQRLLVPTPPPARNKTVLGELVAGRDVPMTLTRCYQCGRVVPVDECVRRNVQTGSGHIWGQGISGSSSSYARVDLCRSCSGEMDRRMADERRTYDAIYWTLLSIGLALVLAAFVLVILIGVGVLPPLPGG